MDPNMPKCPGDSARNLEGVTVKCPDCGLEIEFFSDEEERRCKCGRMLTREMATEAEA